MKKSSLRSKIPPAIREQLAEDPWMLYCVASHLGYCEGRVQWHHGFTYSGKRQNHLWSIVPLCIKHHDRADTDRVKKLVNKAMNYRIVRFDAYDQFKRLYPRSKLI